MAKNHRDHTAQVSWVALGLFLDILQGDRTQVRCLDEINLLQKKMYVQGLLYLSAFGFNFLVYF